MYSGNPEYYPVGLNLVYLLTLYVYGLRYGEWCHERSLVEKQRKISNNPYLGFLWSFPAALCKQAIASSKLSISRTTLRRNIYSYRYFFLIKHATVQVLGPEDRALSRNSNCFYQKHGFSLLRRGRISRRCIYAGYTSLKLLIIRNLSLKSLTIRNLSISY